MKKMIKVGKGRTKGFLCNICHHYYPKIVMKHIRKRRLKVCPNCYDEETGNR